MGTGHEIRTGSQISFFIGQQVADFVCIETPSAGPAVIPTVLIF